MGSLIVCTRGNGFETQQPYVKLTPVVKWIHFACHNEATTFSCGLRSVDASHQLWFFGVRGFFLGSMFGVRLGRIRTRTRVVPNSNLYPGASVEYAFIAFGTWSCLLYARKNPCRSKRNDTRLKFIGSEHRSSLSEHRSAPSQQRAALLFSVRHSWRREAAVRVQRPFHAPIETVPRSSPAPQSAGRSRKGSAKTRYMRYSCIANR